MSLLAHARPWLLSGERPSPIPARRGIDTHLSTQWLMDQNSGDHPLRCFPQFELPFFVNWRDIMVPQRIKGPIAVQFNFHKISTPHIFQQKTTPKYPNTPLFEAQTSNSKLATFQRQFLFVFQVTRSSYSEVSNVAAGRRLESPRRHTWQRPH